MSVKLPGLRPTQAEDELRVLAMLELAGDDGLSIEAVTRRIGGASARARANRILRALAHQGLARRQPGVLGYWEIYSESLVS